MATSAVNGNGVSRDTVLENCVATLQRVAQYRLPFAVDRRLLWLSENKAQLTETEHEELDALVEMSEERTIEKLQAQATLHGMAALWPHLVTVAHDCWKAPAGMN